MPKPQPSTYPCPVFLETLLEAHSDAGRLHHLSVCETTGGRFQASFKRHDTHGYKVHVAETAIEAIMFVLGPDFGHPWSEILGEAYIGIEKPSGRDDDDDDDDGFGDIL